MKSMFCAAVFAAILISGRCYGAHCGEPGALKVHKSASGNAFVFYPFRSYGDSSFVLPGKDFRKDSSSPPGTVQFFVDGIHYQFLTTPKAKFIVDGEPNDEATVLARHTVYEREFIGRVGNPESEFKEIGSRQRAAFEGTPALFFKLWQMKTSKKNDKATQFFLTTVIGDDVAMLSAISSRVKDEAPLMSALDSFAQTYRFLLSEEACPPK